MLFGIDGMVLAFLLFCAFLFGYFLFEKDATYRNRVKLIKALSSEAYFHSLLIGPAFKNEPWIIGDKKIHTDAKYIVILKRGAEPIAVLGFDIHSRVLRVRQMQGLKGVNMKGVALGPLLIPVAEKIARVLKKEILWIEAAERNFYYTRSLLNTEKRYPELLLHRLRMSTLYNDVPRSMGFSVDTRNTNYVLGHYKILRKKKSLKRWFKLQALLLHRGLKNIESPGSFDETP